MSWDFQTHSNHTYLPVSCTVDYFVFFNSHFVLFYFVLFSKILLVTAKSSNIRILSKSPIPLQNSINVSFISCLYENVCCKGKEREFSDDLHSTVFLESSFGTPGRGWLLLFFIILLMIRATKCTSNVIKCIEYSPILLNFKFFALIFLLC